jgi:hypothetical protein
MWMKRLASLGALAFLAACDSSSPPSDKGGVEDCVSSNGKTICPSCPDEAHVANNAPCSIAGQECKYLRAYCPEHPLGPFYYYENAVYRCENGTWQSKGQDCYDCCRLPLGGGSISDGGETPPSNDCTTQGTYPNCGTCTQTLQEYCATSASCVLEQSKICTRIWFGADWSRGCGYVRVAYFGDVGDQATDIWDEASGNLIYHWFNGRLSSGCLPAKTVGAAPACDAWTNPCGTDAGAAGGG